MQYLIKNLLPLNHLNITYPIITRKNCDADNKQFYNNIKKTLITPNLSVPIVEMYINIFLLMILYLKNIAVQ